MNAIRGGTILALALVATLATSRTANAGANETPGENKRPHTYSAFLPVTDEFGPGDDRIFRKYVVKSQHYSLGAIYTDKGDDEVIGGGGVWNFFTFCTNRSADVMLLSSHGLSDPLTLVDCYAATARGKAIRDSLYAYYSGIFVAGAFESVNFTDSTYGICATQTFYTTYFQTPQAFAWWSTCYSSLLNMTGPAEARCYVGYDKAVLVRKCLCDDEYVLNRMDGQQGQDKRPLGAAIVGVAAACVDPKAALVAKGKLNTVLSPSVLDYEPKGIVCNPVPGFVQFDCSLDTSIPPAAVVSATGDGFLTSHMWSGNDRVTYYVVPTKPCPTILYDVHENTAISVADHARLDGNTNPAVNARGPNQDDFIWTTTCPQCPNPVWYTLLTTIANALEDLAAGNVFKVYTPITNMTGGPVSGTVGFHIEGLPLPVESTPLSLAGGETRLLSWDVPIPSNALPGQNWAMHLIALPDAQASYQVDGTLVLGQELRASITGRATVAEGSNTIPVLIENASGQSEALSGLGVSDNNGWTAGVTPTALTLEARGSAIVQVACTVPPATPNATTDGLTLNGIGPNGAITLPLGSVEVHAPLDMRLRGYVDCVPGSGNAQVQVDVVDLGDHPLSMTYSVGSADGYPISWSLPPTLQPNVPASGFIQISLPNDPTLVGKTTGITVTCYTQDGVDFIFDLSVPMTPALDPDLSALKATRLYTGWSTTHAFSSVIPVRNHSDFPLTGTLMINGLLPFAPATTPLNVAPHGQQVVPVTIPLPVNFPAEPCPTILTLSSTPAIGNSQTNFELLVTQPVLVDLYDQAWATLPGQPLVVSARLTNLRNDRAMTGSFQWTDDQAWLQGPTSGTYNLSAGQTSPVSITVQRPVSLLLTTTGPVLDSLALNIGITYDTGMPSTSFADTKVLDPGGGATAVPGPGAAARATELEWIRPNPMGEHADVRFRLAAAGHARVTVIDAAGRRVATLVDAELTAGEHDARWDGRSEGGGRAAVGVYFMRLESANGVQARKAVLMR